MYKDGAYKKLWPTYCMQVRVEKNGPTVDFKCPSHSGALH